MAWTQATIRAVCLILPTCNPLLGLAWALDQEANKGLYEQWLRTDLGSQYADLDVSVGAKEVRRIVLDADTSDNGKFRNILVPGWENADGPNRYDGGEVPW